MSTPRIVVLFDWRDSPNVHWGPLIACSLMLLFSVALVPMLSQRYPNVGPMLSQWPLTEFISFGMLAECWLVVGAAKRATPEQILINGNQ